MPSEIRDIGNNKISYKVLNVTPKENPILIKNRLLNGVTTFQTIGDSERQFDVSFIINGIDKITLDQHYATATPITVVTGYETIHGIIDQDPIYELEVPGITSNRLYRCELLITEAD